MDTTFLNALSDSDLLVRVQRLVHGECRTTAALVAHLAEIENRKLYLRDSCASMFVYRTRALHLPEHAAYHRIAAARLVQRFPAVLTALECGDVHVTALEMLAGHLTPENHQELLAAAKHKSKREMLELIERVHPKPDVAAAVRKVRAKPVAVMPAAHSAVAAGGGAAGAVAGGAGAGAMAAPRAPRCLHSRRLPGRRRRKSCRWHRSVTKCSSRRVRTLATSCSGRRNSCGIEFRMVTWRRSSMRRWTCWCGISSARSSRPRAGRGAPRRTAVPRRPGRRPVLSWPEMRSRRSKARIHGTFLRTSNERCGNGTRGAARS